MAGINVNDDSMKSKQNRSRSFGPDVATLVKELEQRLASFRDHAPGRKRHYNISLKEQAPYRQAKSSDEVSDLDRCIFENHTDLVTFDRPMGKYDLPKDYCGQLPGMVRVLRINESMRIRVLVGNVVQN